jgi:hypothetical protein
VFLREIGKMTITEALNSSADMLRAAVLFHTPNFVFA